MSTQDPYFTHGGDILAGWFVHGETTGGVTAALPGMMVEETAGQVTSAVVNTTPRPPGVSRTLGGDFAGEGWSVLNEANAGKQSALPGVMLLEEVGTPAPPNPGSVRRSRVFPVS